MATETQDHPNRLNAPKIELCSTLSLSKGLLCIAFCEAGSSLAPLHLSRMLYKSALFIENKPNFQKSQMNVSILLQMDYENKRDWTIGQNKPNSKPIQSQSNPICRMPKMGVNSILTKDYERNDIFAVPENKPKSNPKQTQFFKDANICS